MKRTILGLLTIVILLAGPEVAWGKTASELLQQGLYQEEVEGDVKAACASYEQAAADPAAPPAVGAQALYRLGMCQMKQGQETQARATLEKLLAKYPAQTEVAAKARQLLEDLITPDPAALMPPETIVYYEVGSPGKQVATVLKMLEGTPFANPLAMMGGGAPQNQAQGSGPGDKSPQQIFQALLNPAMVEEFKKIRGFAVGLSEVKQGIPPLVAVLYPGKSDALRGLIIAGLGMAGQAAEVVEGMQTVKIADNQLAAAYDEKVVIIAAPPERLAWCIRQHKGLAQEPTLLASNPTLGRIGRTAREQNLITVWAQPNRLFEQFLKMSGSETNMSPQLRAAQEFGDIKNINDAILTFTLDESNPRGTLMLGFKEGHNSLVYNLVRTPHLSPAAFTAVPADAAGLFSFALSDADPATTAARQEKIKQFTGLDVGREVFANIEQVTLFVLPPTPESARSKLANMTMPLMSGLGLVLSSHDPEKTRQVLGELLRASSAASKLSGGNMSQPEPGPGQFYMNSFLTVNLDGLDRATLLTISPEARQAVLQAGQSKRSVLTEGPLATQLKRLNPDASKLILVSVPGALRVMEALVIPPKADPNASQQAAALFEQLRQAFAATSVQLATAETPTMLHAQVGINELPPLGGVIPLGMGLPSAIAKAERSARRPAPSVAQAAPAGPQRPVAPQTPASIRSQVPRRPVASNPMPPNGSSVAPVPPDQVFFWWTPASGIKAQKLYLGETELTLMNEYDSRINNFTKILEKDKNYRWRVDSVMEDGRIVEGPVWSFRTDGKLAGHWQFDEGGTDIAADTSGNDVKALLCGKIRWVEGRQGAALRFDGQDDSVTTADPLNSPTVTVAAWIRAHAWGPNYYSATIAGNDYWSPEPMTTTSFGYVLRCGENGRINFAVGVNRDWPTAFSQSLMKLNQWHHVAGTYDGTTVRIFLDGQPTGTRIAAGTISPSTFNFTIGRGAYARERIFTGDIDDVRVYNYPLSPEEIRSLCNQAGQ